MNLKKITKSLILILLVIPSIVRSNSDPVVDIKMIANNCNSCHGYEDIKIEFMPSINSLDKNLFLKKMKEYKLKNSEGIMSRLVKELSIEDINRLANYYFDIK